MSTAKRRRNDPGSSKETAREPGDEELARSLIDREGNPTVTTEPDAETKAAPNRRPDPSDSPEGNKDMATEAGSVIEQIGSLLFDGDGEDEEAPDGAAPPEAGDGDAGAALENATADAILGTIACSAVQGLRRAAAAKSMPVKAFWIVMVLLSIGLFVRGAVILSMRLANVRVEKTYQLDKVPFVFPDLYFCPSNSYSGSFPYTLDQSQAELIDKEVERLNQLFDLQQPTSGHGNSSKTRIWLIQQSMPVHLLKEYIMHRPGQSLFFPPLITNVGLADHESIVLPGNKICFKVLLSEVHRDYLVKRQNNEALRLALFTDPYFANFQYTGHPIKPIFNQLTNESVPFKVWYPSGIINMMSFGYTMLIVPQGVYPSFDHETKFKLAPGKSYDIEISMEESRFSDELWGKHCCPDHENAAFVDHLTGERVEYNYSYDACYFTELARSLHKVAGYVQQGYPITWDLKGSPRWGNLTENLRINRSTEQYGEDMRKAHEMIDPTNLCLRQQPCVQNKYGAKFSLQNWPSMGQYSYAFRDADPSVRPALAHILRMAKEFDSGNQSSQSHAEFRHIVTDSLLEVRIRTVNSVAPRLLMTASYSTTSFTSDLGGLMGLYLGCSVLTLFELLEILYMKASIVVAARCRRRRLSTGASQNDDETNGAAVLSREMSRLDGGRDGSDSEENVYCRDGVA